MAMSEYIRHETFEEQVRTISLKEEHDWAEPTE